MNYPKPGDTADVLDLLELRRSSHINVYLYMDAEIARTESVEEGIAKYRLTDLDYRPVLEIEDWFKHMKKQMKQIAGASADFEEMLKSEPLIADVLETGTIQTPAGARPYLKCLLPYLDEMEEMEVRNASDFRQK
ncbi:MAG TPA: hypothetical protein O0X97_03275 [Methanocorpusculum sp.]|nr:hypothetical protein [Methanocorpusculum sp.]